MEKKKKSKIIKILLLAMLLVIFFGLIIAEIWLNDLLSDLSISNYMYWVIFVTWIYIIAAFKVESRTSLVIAFVLYIAASFITIVGGDGYAEIIMRVSFMGWVLGIMQALLEYRKEHG